HVQPHVVLILVALLGGLALTTRYARRTLKRALLSGREAWSRWRRISLRGRVWAWGRRVVLKHEGQWIRIFSSIGLVLIPLALRFILFALVWRQVVSAVWVLWPIDMIPHFPWGYMLLSYVVQSLFGISYAS